MRTSGSENKTSIRSNTLKSQCDAVRTCIKTLVNWLLVSQVLGINESLAFSEEISRTL